MGRVYGSEKWVGGRGGVGVEDTRGSVGGRRHLYTGSEVVWFVQIFGFNGKRRFVERRRQRTKSLSLTSRLENRNRSLYPTRILPSLFLLSIIKNTWVGTRNMVYETYTHIKWVLRHSLPNKDNGKMFTPLTRVSLPHWIRSSLSIYRLEFSSWILLLTDWILPAKTPTQAVPRLGYDWLSWSFAGRIQSVRSRI